MKTIKLSLLFLFVSISFISCSSDNNQNQEEPTLIEYREELNVSYGSDNDQKFDIYLPANRTTDTKVLILVHGGGWTSGDKSDMNAFKDIILSDLQDIAVVNINYRLADQNNQPYPMQINDITSVVNHLKVNQSEYVISDTFGFIGTSAGAHLSLLWSYAFDTENDITMVCSIVGPTNFTDPAYLNNTDPALQELIDLYGINPAINYLEEVSPYHQATTTAPPTILFYGGQDPLIPTTQGTAMRDKLQDLGVTHEFTLYPNAGHGWIGLELIDTWQKLKLFTETYL
ncbi:acetyl esterase/lipase [Ichthyenterobacterium magnum]|uniref:Acetyl esterase/lipase n=2 Tax=Ichthyenterobacterium magnum TaxID=1230530 RepID=A0A420DKY4_9FLAO|nr:acetyl esterase/lipase [Ichthyenterobacterium magnum]